MEINLSKLKGVKDVVQDMTRDEFADLVSFMFKHHFNYVLDCILVAKLKRYMNEHERAYCDAIEQELLKREGGDGE